MMTSSLAQSLEPLTLRPLPTPDQPLVERRVRRSPNAHGALQIVLSEAVRRSGCDVVLVTDEEGMIVAHSTTTLALDMLAAVTPIVARGEARAHIKRRGESRDLSVETTSLLGETLHVAALGAEEPVRREQLVRCIAALHRILGE